MADAKSVCSCRGNVGKSKVMCSRYGNGGTMHVILKGEPLEEVDCFKYLGSQVAAMEDVKGVWYTECMRDIERAER